MKSAAMMRMVALALPLAIAAPWSALAQASEIFVCVDDNGVKSFQNVGNVKGCKRLDVQPVLTVPAPRQPVVRNGVQPAVAERTSFPRVDAETQRTRDSDRRRILEDELRNEEEKLGRLKAEYANGEPERRGDERNYALYRERVQRLAEDITRAENNLTSLRRELALLRTQ